MHVETFLLAAAVVVFGLGTWLGRGPAPGPYYWPICLGLFFLSLSMLWPQLVK